LIVVDERFKGNKYVLTLKPAAYDIMTPISDFKKCRKVFPCFCSDAKELLLILKLV
jgi:hypothetical protein